MDQFHVFTDSNFFNLIQPVSDDMRSRLIISEGDKIIQAGGTTIFPTSKFDRENIMMCLSAYQFGAIHIDDLPDNPDWATLQFVLSRVRGTLNSSTISKPAKMKLQENKEGFIQHFKSDHTNGDIAFERAFQFFVTICNMNETE